MTVNRDENAGKNQRPDVKYAPGPRFPLPEEMPFSTLLREYVMVILDTTPGSEPKKLTILAAEIDKRVKLKTPKKEEVAEPPKVETTPKEA